MESTKFELRFNEKRQVIIPKSARDKLGLRDGDLFTITFKGLWAIMAKADTKAHETTEKVRVNADLFIYSDD